MKPKRVTEEDALRWRSLYEDDEWTIEKIALEEGRSLRTVRIWLHKVNTTMRAPGGRDPNPPKLPAVGGRVKMVRTNYRGHRRRGRWT